MGQCGLVDSKAIGKKGGSRSPLTRLRRAADDDLREKARQALAEALDGDDEKRRFEAAKSLYSFRAASPPEDRRADGEYAGERMPDGRRPISLCDVLAWAMTNESTRAVAEAAIAQAQQAAPPESFSRNPASSALTPRT
jgi:hypothetical protein